MKVLQVNFSANTGSTGRLAENIGNIIIDKGHESYMAYGRKFHPSKSQLIRIGGKRDIILHGVKSRLLDRHGFGSTQATIKFVEDIKKIKPDVILLHNMHGYYLNVEVFFEFLSTANIPVFWLLYDCWAFTGHCTYFDTVNCSKWKEECHSCPQLNRYPQSLFVDNSRKNFYDKKRIFNQIPNMQLIVNSNWLSELVKKSFLSGFKVHVVHSGIDLDKYNIILNDDIRKKYAIGDKRVILGVANAWGSGRKGLKDFIQLNDYISDDAVIVIVGLNKKQIAKLPKRIIGIERTESVRELSELYSCADVFMNPTWEDNFPTTNLEALACGTPVITYNTGGSVEAIDEHTGCIVEKGDIEGLWNATKKVMGNNRSQYRKLCRAKAEQNYDMHTRGLDYLQLLSSS